MRAKRSDLKSIDNPFAPVYTFDAASMGCFDQSPTTMSK